LVAVAAVATAQAATATATEEAMAAVWRVAVSMKRASAGVQAVAATG